MLKAPADPTCRAIIERPQQVEAREHLLLLNPVPLRAAAAWIMQQKVAWNRRPEALNRKLSAPASIGVSGLPTLEEREHMTNADHCVSVTREIAATLDQVYAAWTEPALMQRWMAQTIEADVRVGGRYRHEMAGDDGQIYIHTGEYLVLEPGQRIVQTFHGCPEDAPALAHREFLEITLRPSGTIRTELTLADCWDGEGMDPEGEDVVKAAWSGWLDGLTRVMGS